MRRRKRMPHNAGWAEALLAARKRLVPLRHALDRLDAVDFAAGEGRMGTDTEAFEAVLAALNDATNIATQIKNDLLTAFHQSIKLPINPKPEGPQPE